MEGHSKTKNDENCLLDQLTISIEFIMSIITGKDEMILTES